MTKWIRLLLILTAISAVILFSAACKKKKSKSPNNNQPTAEATNPSGVDNTPVSGGANSTLDNLAGEFGKHEAKITYDYTSSAGGTDTTGSFVIYSKPPNKWRVDFNSDGSSSSFINDGTNTYICSDEGGGTCIKSPTSSFPLPFLSSFTDPSGFRDTISSEMSGLNFDQSSETIAGQSADCFTASGDVQGEQGSVEYCFSSDGVLLRLKTTSTSGGNFSFEATDVGGSVSDSDVSPPYAPIDIPGQ